MIKWNNVGHTTWRGDSWDSWLWSKQKYQWNEVREGNVLVLNNLACYFFAHTTPCLQQCEIWYQAIAWHTSLGIIVWFYVPTPTLFFLIFAYDHHHQRRLRLGFIPTSSSSPSLALRRLNTDSTHARPPKWCQSVCVATWYAERWFQVHDSLNCVSTLLEYFCFILCDVCRLISSSSVFTKMGMPWVAACYLFHFWQCSSSFIMWDHLRN